MLELIAFDERHARAVSELCAAEGWPSWTPENVARAFAAPGVIAATALDDGTVVGAAQLLTDGCVIAYLGLLVVAHDHRGQGIGRALVADAFERCGLGRIDLLSEAGSTPFYESLPHKVKPGYRIYRDAS